jgi:hypothetical protein
VAQREAFGRQQRFGLRAAQARLQHGGHRLVVDLDQLVEADQVQRDHAGEPFPARREAADDRGAATERDQGHVSAHAPGDHRGDLVVGAGPDDRVGGVEAVAVPQLEQVGGRLAAGAVQPRVVVGQHVLRADDLTELGEQRLVERLAEPNLVRSDRRGVAGAEERVHERASRLGQRAGLGGVSPAGPVHLPGHLRARLRSRHVLQCDT